MNDFEFDIAKKGYDKAQVEEYLEKVADEYNKMYSEYQKVFSLYKKYKGLYEASQLKIQELEHERNNGSTALVPQAQMEAIAMALVDAEVAGRQIIEAAREKAWKMITDAKKGLPADLQDTPEQVHMTGQAPQPLFTTKEAPKAESAQSAASQSASPQPTEKTTAAQPEKAPAVSFTDEPVVSQQHTAEKKKGSFDWSAASLEELTAYVLGDQSERRRAGEK